eukprot:8953147-Pyramimonas_sp.AAC.1
MASKTAKMAQDGLQDGPRWPPKRLRWPHDASKTAQDGLKMIYDGPTGPQDASKTAQWPSKTSSRKARKGQNP